MVYADDTYLLLIFIFMNTRLLYIGPCCTVMVSMKKIYNITCNFTEMSHSYMWHFKLSVVEGLHNITVIIRSSNYIKIFTCTQ